MSDKERYPEGICLGDGYELWTRRERIGDDVTVYFNNNSMEKKVIESISTNFIDNPLNGLTEVTIKIQLKGIEE